MLNFIQLRDFALVRELSVDFQAGLTVLTGETGAGKSILVEALGLVLGNRADSAMVRHGARRAEICAGFTVPEGAPARTWLQARELDEDDECLLRRTVGVEGRSRAYINGRPVSRRQLLELGALLVDIHGQHEHQSLMRRDFQLQLLDEYADHPALLAAVAEYHETLCRLEAEQAELERLASEDGDRLALLRYQLQELQALELSAEAIEGLEEEYQRLAHAGELLATARQALSQLEAEEGAAPVAALARLNTALQGMQGTDPRLGPVVELLDGALIQLQEAAAELRHYCDGLELDPARLREVEQRLSALHDLARKHRVSLAELPALSHRLAQRCEHLAAAEGRRGALAGEIARARARYAEAAAALRESRRRAAGRLAEEVSERMARLGISGGRFVVAVEPLPGKRHSARGSDGVEFQVSANPGHPLRPLAKVASGGELSRISLAIHVATAQRGGVPTLVFDEVDVGVGGRIAAVIGQELRTLSARRQILCITHLPQVAAQGHWHYRVSKTAAEDVATTDIQSLDEAARREEIARMLGGVRVTARTRAHARELIEAAED